MPIAKRNPGSTDKDSFEMELPEVIHVSEKSITQRGRPRTRDAAGAKKRHGWYSDAKKLEVACAYAVSGNSRRVSELTKIPEGTIRAWKQTVWWHEIQSRIHQEQNEELDVKLTKLVDKAVDQINDRLESGDFVYNAKEDKLVRKPVNAKDIAIVTAITLDKRQLLRGEPTQRVEKISENEKLTRLAEQFKKFALAKEIDNDAERIEQELAQGDNDDATQIGEVEESNLNEHQDGNGSWETSEAGDSHSDEQSWDEQEYEEETQEDDEEGITINQLFSE